MFVQQSQQHRNDNLLPYVDINDDFWDTSTDDDVELRYRSIITSLLHASPRVSPRVVRVEGAKIYRGKVRFHVTGHGFSTRRLVAFHDMWHFHDTTRGISTKRVMEFPRDQLPWNLAWNIHETSSRGA